MPLARLAAPRATLLGVRGRSTEEGIQRWFRRFDLKRFDQNDIRFEAEAFEAFVEGAVAAYGIDPERTAFIGNSNGANLLAAFMRLHPHVVRKAVLLRATDVLEEQPIADLSDASVLLLNGIGDPFGDASGKLEAALRADGAAVDVLSAEGGHGLSDEDVRLIVMVPVAIHRDELLCPVGLVDQQRPIVLAMEEREHVLHAVEHVAAHVTRDGQVPWRCGHGNAGRRHLAVSKSHGYPLRALPELITPSVSSDAEINIESCIFAILPPALPPGAKSHWCAPCALSQARLARPRSSQSLRAPPRC